MYLAQKIINNRRHYFIRQSYRHDNSYLSRDIFDLGTDPSRYIIYPGGNSFYIDDTVTDRLESFGIMTADDELEDIFWNFLKPDVQRALETFRHREKRSHPGRRLKDSKKPGTQYHIFDRRRIYYLKFGRMDQRGLDALPGKLFRFLQHKSRDEIEQKFIEMETILRPTEYKAYTYVIFNLQAFFSDWFARETPQMLDQQKVDQYFIAEICALNSDRKFWFGMPVGTALHEYLARYAILYFDFDYAPKSFLEDYLRNFINSRRDYRAPFQSSTVTLSEAITVFGKSKSELKQMSRRDFARLYRKRAQKFHPDKGGDHETFVKLTRAYHELLKTKE